MTERNLYGFELPKFGMPQQTYVTGTGLRPFTNSSIQSYGMDQNPLGTTSLESLEFGLNAPTLDFGLKGAASLANIWGAFQANKMSKKDFGFQKEMANANLNNSISSYNTALEGRANRAAQFNGTENTSYVRDYLERHALSRGGKVNNGATPRKEDEQAQRTV